MSLVVLASLYSNAFAKIEINSQANDQINFTEEERLWIKEHPVVRVSNYRNWAPIDFTVEGKPAGFPLIMLN